MVHTYSLPTETPRGSEAHIYTGYSKQTDASEAAREIREQIAHRDTGLSITFISNRYERETMARDLHREFGETTVIGCTTAGEIGPMGYENEGVAGVGFGRDDVIFQVGLMDGISKMSPAQCQRFAYDLRQRLLQEASNFDVSMCFALLLIDGLSGHEEYVARAVHEGLGGIAMVGGSAGDGMAFQKTGVLYQGAFRADAALLLVAASPHPITTFKSQHFVAGERRLVLTGAIPERRIATEINGLPAAQEYARAVGVERSQLGPHIFSAHPLVVKIGGADFVRSIQKVHDDDTLTFFCAIDEGIVFNVAERVDLASNLEMLFSEIEQRIGSPRLVLGCDCILRRLEIEQSGMKDDVSAILRKHHVIGFNSYGEQYRGMHVNQTFTGVAIGTATNHKGSANTNGDIHSLGVNRCAA